MTRRAIFKRGLPESRTYQGKAGRNTKSRGEALRRIFGPGGCQPRGGGDRGGQPRARGKKGARSIQFVAHIAREAIGVACHAPHPVSNRSSASKREQQPASPPPPPSPREREDARERTHRELCGPTMELDSDPREQGEQGDTSTSKSASVRRSSRRKGHDISVLNKRTLIKMCIYVQTA